MVVGASRRGILKDGQVNWRWKVGGDCKPSICKGWGWQVGEELKRYVQGRIVQKLDR